MKKIDGLPANADAERFVLGAVLLSPDQWPVAESLITPEHFDLSANRVIWQAMMEISKSGERIDCVTVSDKLNRMGNLQAAGGYSAVVGLTDGMPAVFDLEAYIKIVRRCHDQRRIVYACGDISTMAMRGEEEPEVIAALAESRLRGIVSTGEKSELRDVGQWMSTHRDHIFDPASVTQRRPTGWRSLDLIYNGWYPGKVVTVAARTSVGKSAWAAQAAMQVASTGAVVNIFTMEMDGPEIISRLACGRAGVSAWKHQRGFLSPEEVRAYRTAVADIAAMPLYIQYTPGLSRAGIRAAVARQHARGIKPEVNVIDYLQLLDMQGDNRNEVIGATMRAFKRDAGEWGCCNVVLSQLNRRSEYENRAPSLSDLKESGSIEEDSSDVLLLHRDNSKVSDRRNPHPMTIILAKQRGGMVSQCELLFEPGYVRFSDIGSTQD